MGIAVIVTVAGCGNSGSKATGQPAPTGSRTPVFSVPGATADPETETKSAVLAAYQAHWQDVVEAGKTADYDSPLLERHATGQQLRTSRLLLFNAHRAGHVLRGTVKTNAEVMAINGAKATVRDCIDGSQWYEVDSKTGKRIPNTSPAPDLYTAALVRSNGTWKVSDAVVKANQC